VDSLPCGHAGLLRFTYEGEIGCNHMLGCEVDARGVCRYWVVSKKSRNDNGPAGSSIRVRNKLHYPHRSTMHNNRVDFCTVNDDGNV
jgi:hypothetical protein